LPELSPARKDPRDPDADVAVVRGGAEGNIEIAMCGLGEIAEVERQVATAVSSLEIGQGKLGGPAWST
jgi:hypothetical protein